jgi:membrane protease YdiL (CAAX protease family)
MNLEINSFLVIFIIMMISLSIVYPISGYIQQKKLKKRISDGGYNKIKWYRDTIIWSWIPVLLILLLIPLSNMTLGNIGIKWINIGTLLLNNWIKYSLVGLYFIYFSYNVYSIIVLKYSKKSRSIAAASIPDNFRIFFPITKREKRTWDFVAISAGITEEIIYRGYLFYALGIIFPNISLILILLISTIAFGIGHIYQGKEAIRPTLIGFIFGIFYIVFNSIIPIIIIHIAQDFVVRYILDEEGVEKK